MAVMPCPTLVASGLLYFLFIVAIRGWGGPHCAGGCRSSGSRTLLQGCD
jgi:hypothetical protein